MKYFNKVMSIDVGENTAFANWTGTKIPETVEFTSKNYVLLLEMFEVVLMRFLPIKVYMEDSVMLGIMSTAANERFTFLTQLVGGYRARCARLNIKCEMISVIKWKGQLKDKQVANWIYEATEQKYNSPHVRSAVGIGLYKMGVF